MEAYLEQLHVEVHDLKELALRDLWPQLRVGLCLFAVVILVKQVRGHFWTVQKPAASSPPRLGQVLEQGWQQQERLSLRVR